MQSQNIQLFTAAFVKAQASMEGAKKDRKNEHFRSSYATLESALEATKEALNKNGICIIQMPAEAVAGYVGLRTTLIHESGEFISEVFNMPVKDASNPQAVGSAITYARRYALMGVCGIAPEDDDGNGAAAEAVTVRDAALGAKKTAELHRLFQAAVTKSAGDSDKLKAIYAEARSSSMSEQIKTDFLAGLANTIKDIIATK